MTTLYRACGARSRALGLLSSARPAGLAVAAAALAVFGLTASGASAAEAPAARTVSVVEFRGLTSLDPVALKRMISTRPGLPFSPAVANRDVLRLEELKCFEIITVATEDTASGVRVIFNAVERPFVRSIAVVGSRLVSKRKVLGNIKKTAVGERYDPAAAAADCAEILLYLHERSLHDAKVTSSAAPMEGAAPGRPEGVRVIFTVDEGDYVEVASVDFDGATAIKRKDLLHSARLLGREVKVRAGRALPQDWELEYDAAGVRDVYLDKGYLDVAVTVSKGERKPARHGFVASVTFTVAEGPQYKVGAVTVEGNTLVSTERVLAAMKLKRGGVYSDSAKAADAQAAFTLYGEQGRVFTDAGIERRLADEPATVNLAVRIREGEVVRVREVEPLGNTKTRDIVILREMLLAPGDTFDITKYRRSLKRLNRLGIFDPTKLNAHIQRTDDPAEADIIVEVEEQMTGLFQFGFGYSSNDEFVGQFSLEQRNFNLWDWPRSWGDFFSGNSFVGDGQRLSLNASWGSVTSSVSINWLEPWLFNRPIKLGVSLYDTMRDYGDYEEARTGTKVTLGKRWENDWGVSLFGEIENVRIDDIDSDVDPLHPIRDELGMSRINSAGVSVSYDSRDSWMMPTEGLNLELSHEAAGGALSGDIDFLRSRAHLSGHIPIGWRKVAGRPLPLVLSLRVQGDWIVPYGDSADVPVYERLFAGGLGTIRGFDYRSVSPRFPDAEGDVVGGRMRLLENAELSLPLVGESGELRLSFFFDAGNVWPDPNDFEFDDQKKSWGFGLVILTPPQAGGFPIKIYWGFPIDRKSTDDVERISFMFGSMF